MRPDEMQRRTDEFGVSPQTLREAIKEVGPLVKHLREHLGSRRRAIASSDLGREERLKVAELV